MPYASYAQPFYMSINKIVVFTDFYDNFEIFSRLHKRFS